jgi:hypothetical protein
MIELLAISIVIAAVCNGLIIVTSNGQLLYFVRQFMERVFVNTNNEDEIHWLYKPLLLCPSCMPSIYGTAIYILHYGISYDMLFQLPIVLFCSVTFSTIINQQFV